MTTAELDAALAASLCTVDAMGRLIHPGLPVVWGIAVGTSMAIVCAWAIMAPAVNESRQTQHFNLAAVPRVGDFIRYITSHAWFLLVLKLVFVALFLLIIVAGLYGTPIAERNAATVLTWNLWWAGLVISVFFLGSAWCAVCPWDTLATVFVRRRRLWGKVRPETSLNLRVPGYLRTVWPALILLVGLTWLELGAGVTVSPYATAGLALTMVVLATLSLAVFERKAFCRYFCPVGRTVGCYSQLAPVEIRPADPSICASCTTLDCYYGNDTVEPCPTHLVMGRLKQNTYCTSCGNCARSCPYENVAWRLRSPSSEAIQDARPHWDEAWFMLGLLALTGFHGLTMMGFWEDWMRDFGLAIGDSGQMLWSFTIGFGVSLIIPVALFAAVVWVTGHMNNTAIGFRKLLSQFAFAALPLAFAYHIAHNLNHLVLESGGLGKILANPLGEGTLPLSLLEKQIRGVDMVVSQETLNVLQAGLMAFGFLIAVRVILHRAAILVPQGYQLQFWRSSPILLFAVAMTAYHVWLLMQPMVMRF